MWTPAVAGAARPHELGKRAAAAARRSITVRPGVARVVPSLRQFFSREMGASSREISAAGRGGRSKRGSGGECGLEGERREGGLLRCVLCRAVPGGPSPQCPLQPTSAARPHPRLNAALWERGGRAVPPVPPVPRPRAPAPAPARWAQDAGPGVKHGTARHGTARPGFAPALLCSASLSRGENSSCRPPRARPPAARAELGGGGCCVELIRTKLEQKVVFCSRETGRSWLLTVSAAPVLPAPRLK